MIKMKQAVCASGNLRQTELLTRHQLRVADVADEREVAKISKKEDRSKEEWHPSAKDQESAAKVLFLCGFCLEWHDEMLE